MHYRIGSYYYSYSSLFVFFLYLVTLLSWSNGSWIYNHMWNECISPLIFWVGIMLMTRLTRYSTIDKASSTNKTDHHYINEIVLKVALSTITITLLHYGFSWPLWHAQVLLWLYITGIFTLYLLSSILWYIEQHELHSNQGWTQLFRKGKHFLFH